MLNVIYAHIALLTVLFIPKLLTTIIRVYRRLVYKYL